MRLRLLLTIGVVVAAVTASSAKDDARLKSALQDDLVGAEWIYDDIGRGYQEARKSGKPLLVSFRCVP